ncbi:flavin reductase family protein [Pradoshia sp.]
MISLDPMALSERDNYTFLTGTIIPRPIAIITSISNEGIVNIAPFSYFTIVSANPPMIAVSVQRKNGRKKDTSQNILDSREFVVHITDESNMEDANKTAAELPPNISELEVSNFELTESETIRVPGITNAKVRMECTLAKAIPLGGQVADDASCDLIIGNVTRYHIVESIYENGRIDAKGLRPISRLAGHEYMKIGEQFVLERPK